MTTRAQHSQLPWKVSHNACFRGHSIGFTIRGPLTGNRRIDVIIQGTPTEGQALAEEIVRACNNAPRLADTLKAALPLLEMWMQQHPHVDQSDNCATAAREALKDYDESNERNA